MSAELESLLHKSERSQLMASGRYLDLAEVIVDRTLAMPASIQKSTVELFSDPYFHAKILDHRRSIDRPLTKFVV